MAEVIYAGDAGIFKTCTKCRETKVHGLFYKKNSGAAGVMAICKTCSDADVAKWRHDNPERSRDLKRGWYDSNPDKAKEIKSKWASTNIEQRRISSANYNAKRRSAVRGRLEDAVRSNINNNIRRGTKFGRKTFDILGYSLSDLQSHLEAKFTDGMTWDNYGRGGWHIDHRRPLVSFDYETPDCPEFKQAWALSNLQPLWEIDNISKGSKWPLAA